MLLTQDSKMPWIQYPVRNQRSRKNSSNGRHQQPSCRLTNELDKWAALQGGIWRLHCVPSWKLHAKLLQNTETPQWNAATDQWGNRVTLPQLSCFPSQSQCQPEECLCSGLVGIEGASKATLWLLEGKVSTFKGGWSSAGSLNISNSRQANFQYTSGGLLSWRHHFWCSRALGSA